MGNHWAHLQSVHQAVSRRPLLLAQELELELEYALRSHTISHCLPLDISIRHKSFPAYLFLLDLHQELSGSIQYIQTLEEVG